MVLALTRRQFQIASPCLENGVLLHDMPPDSLRSQLETTDARCDASPPPSRFLWYAWMLCAESFWRSPKYS